MAVEQVIRQAQQEARQGVGGESASRRRLLRQLSQQLRRRLVESAHIDTRSPGAHQRTQAWVQRCLDEEEARQPLLVLSAAERAQVVDRILTSVFGYGVLTPFIRDPAVTEIMVNGPDRIFIEQNGAMVRARDPEGNPLAFEDVAEMLTVIERIVSPLGRKVDESDPIVDARLPDGSRVNIALPPVALAGPTITIRKFPQRPFSMDDLVARGTLTPELRELLAALVRSRANIVVSGATSSGKTTFLNALGMCIPAHERVVTVEDAAELKLTQVENLVPLEARPPNIEGKGQVTIRDLVRTALRMRPDRIVVGECRGGEALDMLQAMNTGHDGSLTTAHANSARELVSRLETMVLMSGMELPIGAIRQQIAGAVDLIIHLARLPDGTRRVVEVCEVLGVEAGEVALADLYRWDPEAGRAGQTATAGATHGPGDDANAADGAVGGALVWTGRQLSRTQKFRLLGVPVPRLGAAAAASPPDAAAESPHPPTDAAPPQPPTDAAPPQPPTGAAPPAAAHVPQPGGRAPAVAESQPEPTPAPPVDEPWQGVAEP